MFFLTILAMLQLRSTSALTLPALDESVNNEMRKLEASIDSSRQQLQVKDISFLPTTSGTSWIYNAFILYEVSDKEPVAKKKP